ncbi:MAG: hypothetical protein RMK81_13830 [Geminicoccaceae bacterium]|nr:hypothetical protein [Geminicoccaceae bacterium]
MAGTSINDRPDASPEAMRLTVSPSAVKRTVPPRSETATRCTTTTIAHPVQGDVRLESVGRLGDGLDRDHPRARDFRREHRVAACIGADVGEQITGPQQVSDERHVREFVEAHIDVARHPGLAAPRPEAGIAREGHDAGLRGGGELPTQHVEQTPDRPTSPDRVGRHEARERPSFSDHVLATLPHAG